MAKDGDRGEERAPFRIDSAVFRPGMAAMPSGTGDHGFHSPDPGPKSSISSGDARFQTPKPRFNPQKTFNFAEARAKGPQTAFRPRVAQAPAHNQGQASASDQDAPKKFNPKSMFNPSGNGGPSPSPFSGGAGPGLSQIGSGLAQTSLGQPGMGQQQTGIGSGIPSHGSGIAAHSDVVPQFSRKANEYAAMYHPPLHPLQYHLYAPSPFRMRPALEKHRRLAEDLFISNDLREQLLQRNEATLQVMPQSTLPEFVHVYHSLFPLDTKMSDTNRFGYKTWKYKAVSNTDGRTYLLARIEGFHLTQERAMQKVKLWERVASASVVNVVEAFTTLAFGDHSLVVVYEYFPLAQPLYEVYTTPVHEGLLWSLAAQLVAGVMSVHKKNLAVRTLDSTSILVTQKDRLRLGLGAVADIIEYEEIFQANCAAQSDSDIPTAQTAPRTPGMPSTTSPPATPRGPSAAAPSIPTTPMTPRNQHGHAGANGVQAPDLAKLQLQDWNKLGNVLHTLVNPKQSVAHAHQKHSPDLMSFIKTLQSDDVTTSTLMPLISPHMWRILDGSLAHADQLEDTLALELENARLVRLMTKLEMITDRPENLQSPRWAPTGDRYFLRLLKDYIFHQTDDQGAPSLDLAHVISALNKLDVGIDENVLLVSPDEQTRLIVSYQELKTAVDQAFRELHPK